MPARRRLVALLFTSIVTCVLTDCASTKLDSDFEAALAVQLAGRHQDAIPLYRSVLAQDPQASGAWHNLGAALLLTGEAKEAIAALLKSIALAPDDILARYLLAVALLQNGAPMQAREVVRQLRIERDRLVNASISRLGMPTYRNVDLRVIGQAFEQKLALIESAATQARRLDSSDERELLVVALREWR